MIWPYYQPITALAFVPLLTSSPLSKTSIVYTQKFTCFKIIIKYLPVVDGRLARALASGASEEKKLLVREETVLVLDKQTGFFSSENVIKLGASGKKGLLSCCKCLFE